MHDSYICTGSPKPLHLSHEDGHSPDIQYVFFGALVKGGSPKSRCSFF